MESSNCTGLVAVAAVSSSVALLVLQLHKRLSSDFIKKLESEIGRSRSRQRKKKVRFAPDVVEPSPNNEEYRRLKTAALSS